MTTAAPDQAPAGITPLYVELMRLSDTRYGPLPPGASCERLYRDCSSLVGGSVRVSSIAVVRPGGLLALDPFEPVIFLQRVHGRENPHVSERGVHTVEYEVTEGTGVVVFAVSQVSFSGVLHRIFAELETPSEGLR